MPVFFTHKNGLVIKLECSVYSQWSSVDALALVCELLEKLPPGEIIAGPEIRKHGWDFAISKPKPKKPAPTKYKSA